MLPSFSQISRKIKNVLMFEYYVDVIKYERFFFKLDKFSCDFFLKKFHTKKK